MSPAKFDAHYFTATYRQNYERRNPPYKWQSFLRELLKFRTSGNLLEIGCGFGLFLQEAKPYFTCVGCDISEYAIAQAQNRLSPQVPLFCSAVGQLSVDNTFDIVAAFDVIEHVADLPQVFNDLNRVLQANGLLIFTVPVYGGPLGWLVTRLDQDKTHIHLRDIDFWLQSIAPQFTVKYYTGIWRYFLFGRYYFNALSHFSRRWTTAILVVAEKKNT